MDEVEKDDTKRLKRTYRKPAFAVVALRPEEAVLGACKTNGSSGPSASKRCRNVGVNCSSQGS